MIKKRTISLTLSAYKAQGSKFPCKVLFGPTISRAKAGSTVQSMPITSYFRAASSFRAKWPPLGKTIYKEKNTY